MQFWINRASKNGRQASQSKPERIHSSYQELDSCSQQCVTCRVIRRGILLNQSTTTDANNLRIRPQEVWATLLGVELNKMTLRVSLQDGPNSTGSAASTTISFSPGQESVITGAKQPFLLQQPFQFQQQFQFPQHFQLPLARTETTSSAKKETPPLEASLTTRADTKAVFNQVRSWAEACNRGHPECGNLNWSGNNPTRLLRIISASEVQLVDAREKTELIRYTALSYCWGSPDDEQTQRGRTTADNFHARHNQSFLIAELPATIRDAIILTQGCGLEYIWVDSVCIIQEDMEDWFTEANRMHEVYANAHFTICAASVDSASAGLFHTRQAWKYVTEPCQLAGKRIAIRSSSLRELIQRSTWSSRAWTLQEEHLSPRMLYWTPQKIYWSCSKCLLIEGESPSKPAPTATPRPPESSFLAASRSGLDLHERWYDLVESFTKRSLTNPTDRFPAISGIAMRYHRYRESDQYLAGLWRDTFAMDLAWKTSVFLLEVQKPLREDQVIPSWSWASLPCGHPAVMRRRQFRGDKRFQLLECRPSHPEEVSMAETTVRSVLVRGRMRPLFSSHAERKDWSDVSVQCADGQEKFSFRSYVGDDVYCVDLSRGRLLAYEAHREETIGHIDYVIDADRVYQGVATIECLELGDSEMLLLERCEAFENDTNSTRKYRRIGVSWDFRSDFFDGKVKADLELV